MILSPLATGNGAYILHKNIESQIENYKVIPYNPYRTLFPPLLFPLGRFNKAKIIHTTPDYGIFHYRKNAPLVLTFHGFVLDKFMQKYSNPLQLIHSKTDLRLFTYLAISKASQLTAVSHFLADIVKKEFGFEKEINVIYNGVNHNAFFPIKRRKNKKIKVLFCGNLTQRKGIQWLLPIIEKLKPNVEILFTTGLKGSKYINHPRLKCVGKVTYGYMVDLYQKVDILLFPSVREGFGLVVAEAMACGLPIVASNCSSLPELVDHAKGGFLCQIGDVDAFAEKLNLLAENPILRHEMGEYNRIKVEEQFTLERMIYEYKNLFEKTLDKR